MKQKLIVFLIILSVVSPLFAGTSLRSKMLESPLKNIAYAREYSDGIINSAAFPFRSDDINFFASSAAREQYTKAPFSNNEKYAFLQNFALDTTFSFGSDSLILTGNIDSGLANRSLINNSLFYDINTYYKLQVDVAYRYKFFSLGFRLEGGNLSQRAQREIGSFTDIFANMFFERFVSVPGSEYFSTGISSFFRLGQFSATLIVDELVKVLDSGSIGTSWRQIFHSLSFGLAYESPRYRKDGNLHFARFRTGLAFEHFLSSENAVTEFTADVDFQLLPDVSVIIGTNLRNEQQLTAAFDGLDLDSTYHGFELKCKFLHGSVALNVYYPLSLYTGWNDNPLRFSLTSSVYF